MLFLQESIQWYNLPYTILLGCVIIYWITVMLGFLDIEFFDFDLDLEVDGVEGFFGLLNLGAVPFSIWLTVFSFFLWLLSIIANVVINSIGLSWLPAPVRFIVLLLVLVILSGIIAKYVTLPLRKLFNFQTITKNDFVGKECQVTSSEVTDSFGTGELRIDGDVQLIDIRIANSDEKIAKGDRAIIFKYDQEKDIFFVNKLDI